MITEDYGNLGLLAGEKNKANMPAFSRKYEVRNSKYETTDKEKMQNKANLFRTAWCVLRKANGFVGCRFYWPADDTPEKNLTKPNDFISLMRKVRAQILSSSISNAEYISLSAVILSYYYWLLSSSNFLRYWFSLRVALRSNTCSAASSIASVVASLRGIKMIADWISERLCR